MDILFGKTIDLLASSLENRSKRHQVLAANISNIDTPGYKPKDVSFEKELEGFIENPDSVKLQVTREGHVGRNFIPVDDDLQVFETGEKVAIDNEMAKLAENHIMYNLSVELLVRKFKTLNSVLREAK